MSKSKARPTFGQHTLKPVRPKKPNPTKLPEPEIATVYERCREQQRHEDSLINHRITWLLSVTGALQAGAFFVLTANAYVPYRATMSAGVLGIALLCSCLFLSGVLCAQDQLRQVKKTWDNAVEVATGKQATSGPGRINVTARADAQTSNGHSESHWTDDEIWERFPRFCGAPTIARSGVYPAVGLCVLTLAMTVGFLICLGMAWTRITDAPQQGAQSSLPNTPLVHPSSGSRADGSPTLSGTRVQSPGSR